MKLITTSWDDGHELDVKLAELLQKYNLKATFYIPRNNAERPVMPASQIRRLSDVFEIGGHTLNHVRLVNQSRQIIKQEVEGSYQWLADVTGKKPASFCFPGGCYNPFVTAAVFKAGYSLARTTELHSTSLPNEKALVGTTMQAFPHHRFTHGKHLLKRQRVNTFLQWIRNGSQVNLIQLAEQYLQKIENKNGCFHLWGHSWEIEQYNLWKKLEALFSLLAQQQDFQSIENQQLLRFVSR